MCGVCFKMAEVKTRYVSLVKFHLFTYFLRKSGVGGGRLGWKCCQRNRSTASRNANRRYCYIKFTLITRELDEQQVMAED